MIEYPHFAEEYVPNLENCDPTSKGLSLLQERRYIPQRQVPLFAHFVLFTFQYRVALL